MTIALGINFDKYILLAADTRTVYFGRDGSVLRHEDDSEKIQRTMIGLITGVGIKRLLDAVKLRLAEQEIKHTDEILQIISEERQRYEEFRKINPSYKHLDSTTTGWIYTYMTPTQEGMRLRLAISHPSIGDGLWIRQTNDPAIICPVEASKEQAEEIGEIMKECIKPFNDFSNIQESIKYHTKIIASLIQTMQPEFPSISQYFQIGIHTVEGGKGISPIIRGNESNISFPLL